MNVIDAQLSIKANVDSLYLVLNDNFDDLYHLADGDTIEVPSGKQRIRLVKKYYRDVITSIEIRTDTMNVLRTYLRPFSNLKHNKLASSYPRIFWEAPAIVKSDSDARIYVNNEFRGKGIARIEKEGFVIVKSELPSGEAKTVRFQTDERSSFVVKEIYHRPEKQKTRLLALVPGVSQIYQGQKLKGIGILGASLAVAGLAIKYHLDFSNKHQDFIDTQSSYLTTQDPQTAFELGNLAEQQLSEANEYANIRNNLMYGIIGLYLYNVVDAMIKPNNGYRNTVNIDPYIDFEKKNRNSVYGLSVSFNF